MGVTDIGPAVPRRSRRTEWEEDEGIGEETELIIAADAARSQAVGH